MYSALFPIFHSLVLSRQNFTIEHLSPVPLYLFLEFCFHFLLCFSLGHVFFPSLSSLSIPMSSDILLAISVQPRCSLLFCQEYPCLILLLYLHSLFYYLLLLYPCLAGTSLYRIAPLVYLLV